MREVLLVGNPNCGKTTLFNSLTRANEHIGNWHGVTMDCVSKAFTYKGEEFLLTDTPGLYSLNPLSFEEEVAVRKIVQGKKIINLCDLNNLQRNLYLSLCLLEAGCDVVIAINQMGKRANCKVDCQKLSQALGVPVVLINAEKKVGVDKLKDCLVETSKPSKLPYSHSDDYEKMSELRYEYIDKLLSECAQRTGQVYGKSKLDKFFLNRWLAFPCFFLVMAGIFYLTFFSLGAWLSDFFNWMLGLISSPILSLIEHSFGQNLIYDLFNVAIFGGVGTVVSFLPQVVLLFFFLSLLEDSGYMSRIAFIFEDILGRIGLSGKSVYTLLMGFGCSTSAIMTARNMDDKHAKIKTAILCPYMSCSAKIPIYTVIGGAFFGAKNVLVIMGLYLLGVVVAVTISKVLDLTVLKSEKQSFILEFPPYRMTSIKRIGKVIWKNSKEFLIRVGSVMVSMNVIIWVLSSFSFSFSYVAGGSGASMLESFGKILSPIFAPLGFDNWAVVSALLAGIAAKEVVVSSIALFNGIDAGASKLLSASLLLPTSVVFFSSVASVLSFLVFCLLYMPCISSIVMLSKEIERKWTWLSILIQLVVAYVCSFVIYNIALAVEIFGFLKIFIIFGTFLLIFAAFFAIFSKIRKKKMCSRCDNCNKKCNRK